MRTVTKECRRDPDDVRVGVSLPVVVFPTLVVPSPVPVIPSPTSVPESGHPDRDSATRPTSTTYDRPRTDPCTSHHRTLRPHTSGLSDLRSHRLHFWTPSSRRRTRAPYTPTPRDSVRFPPGRPDLEWTNHPHSDRSRESNHHSHYSYQTPSSGHTHMTRWSPNTDISRPASPLSPSAPSARTVGIRVRSSDPFPPVPRTTCRSDPSSTSRSRLKVLTSEVYFPVWERGNVP